MQTIKTWTAKGQESLTHLVELGKQQPAQVQTWAVVGGAALAGGLVMGTVAKGVLAVVGTLASTPVSLTVGALAGGVAGWTYLQSQKQQREADPLPVTWSADTPPQDSMLVSE